MKIHDLKKKFLKSFQTWKDNAKGLPLSCVFQERGNICFVKCQKNNIINRKSIQKAWA